MLHINHPEKDPLHAQLKNLKLVITDIDGILTDGGLIYNDHGEYIKRFHVRDGLGIRMLMACGVQVAALSGRDSAVLRKRLSDLGITSYFLGAKDKAARCQELMQAANATPEQTAYLGDDSIDIPAFNTCGLNFTVPEAAVYIRNMVDETLTTAGGHGVFRELSDRILVAQGKADVLTTYEGYKKVMEQMVQ